MPLNIGFRVQSFARLLLNLDRLPVSWNFFYRNSITSTPMDLCRFLLIREEHFLLLKDNVVGLFYGVAHTGMHL